MDIKKRLRQIDKEEIKMNNILSFWFKVKDMIIKKKWSALLMECKQNLKIKNDSYTASLNIYSFLAQRKMKNLKKLESCFRMLKENEKENQNDIMLKFNIFNYLIIFRKYDEALDYIQSLENVLGKLDTLEYGKLFIKEMKGENIISRDSGL